MKYKDERLIKKIMYSVNAISLTSSAHDWLANTSHPRILHVFDRACNLINERKEVLSIVTQQIGNGPFNLVVQHDVCFSEHLRLESEVSTSPTQLCIGSLIVDIANATLWNPSPDWKRLHARKDDIGHQLTQFPITNYPKIASFVTHFEAHGALNQQGLQTAQSLLSNLSSALANADISSALKVTSQLAGLGIGLTPAGDDFIMGAIYAAWIVHPLEVAGTLTLAIANTAAPLTTSLSAAWLRSAGRGEVGILWHQFFDALISVGRIGNPTYLQEAMDNILSVGETSGADALTGFMSTLSYSIPHSSL